MIKVARAGVVIGEYPKADIPALVRAKVILPTDDYWTAGMTGWSKVEGILITESKGSRPPPIPTSKPSNPPQERIIPTPLIALAVCGLIVCAVTAVYLVVKEPSLDPKQKEEFFALKAKAEAGNLRSQMELALLYANGRGVRLNSQEAERLLLDAAKTGNPEVFWSLSEFYRFRPPFETSRTGIRFNGYGDYRRSYAYARLAWSNKDYDEGVTSVVARVVMHSAEERMSAAEVAEAKKLAAAIRDRIFEEKGYRVPLIE
jgi:hypothetical protein